MCRATIGTCLTYSYEYTVIAHADVWTNFVVANLIMSI
jgi:hypothetical protein